MNNTIKCKNCGKEIEVTEALKHQIEEQVLLSERIKHQKDLEVATQKAEEKAAEKIRRELEFSIKTSKEDAEEERKRNKELQEKISERTQELRETKRENENRRIEMEKKLAEEEDKIRLETKKQTEEEHRLKDLEKEKKLQEALQMNAELKQKLEQGSQQTQGEVLEIELEEMLKKEFPTDNIKPVAKGVRGADIIQEVVDKNGNLCGSILWESKNAKWSQTWIAKLKEDQRAAKAHTAVLVSENLPQEVNGSKFINNVWVTNRFSFMTLASALRIGIGQLYHAKLSSVGKNEKIEVLYGYLTGVEFRHRVEAIMEARNSLRDDLEKEKRWFNSKWARQEKEIEKIMSNTSGIYGELQSVTGKAIPEIKILELEDGEE